MNLAKKNTVLVLGASPDFNRYSYRAVTELNQQNYDVTPVGRRNGDINGIKIHQTIPTAQYDIITVYLNVQNQRLYEQKLIQLKPKRIILNPGAENPSFEKLAHKNGIEVIVACSLVMLSLRNFELKP